MGFLQLKERILNGVLLLLFYYTLYSRLFISHNDLLRMYACVYQDYLT